MHCVPPCGKGCLDVFVGVGGCDGTTVVRGM